MFTLDLGLQVAVKMDLHVLNFCVHLYMYIYYIIFFLENVRTQRGFFRGAPGCGQRDTQGVCHQDYQERCSQGEGRSSSDGGPSTTAVRQDVLCIISPYTCISLVWPVA